MKAAKGQCFPTRDVVVRVAVLARDYVTSLPRLQLFGAFYPGDDKPWSCTRVIRSLLQIVILPIVALIVLLLYTTAWLIEALNDLLPPAPRLPDAAASQAPAPRAQRAPQRPAAGLPQ